MKQADERFRMDGLKVFVVEDESLVAMQLEDMLMDMGCDVLEVAMRMTQANAFLDRQTVPDVAILDVNVGGEPVYPVAERFRSADVPIVFATGYGAQGVEEQWRGYPILQKPYTEQQIEQALAEACRPCSDC